MPSDRRELLFELGPVAAVTALAAVLRFATLDAQAFGHDEAITVAQVLEPSLGDTLDAVRRESTPPLYYALAWIWTQPFGEGEVGAARSSRWPRSPPRGSRCCRSRWSRRTSG